MTARFPGWPKRSTTREPSTACPSWAMPWTRPVAPTPTSSVTAEGRGHTSGAAGSLTCCWGRIEVVTEAEWLACADPRQLLNGLRYKSRERQLRLFSCPCCRLAWHLLPRLCHRLVVAVELYTDGELSPTTLATLFDGYDPDRVSCCVKGGDQAAEAVRHLWHWHWQTSTSSVENWGRAVRVARTAAEALAKSMPWQSARQREGLLLHDIFDNAFHSITLNPAWQTPTVVALAQAAYDNRIMCAG